VKLISWNTNARRNAEPQALALLACAPDVVGLREVAARSVGKWVEELKASTAPPPSARAHAEP
jgi:hypothetical protein